MIGLSRWELAGRGPHTVQHIGGGLRISGFTPEAPVAVLLHDARGLFQDNRPFTLCTLVSRRGDIRFPGIGIGMAPRVISEQVDQSLVQAVMLEADYGPAGKEGLQFVERPAGRVLSRKPVSLRPTIEQPLRIERNFAGPYFTGAGGQAYFYQPASDALWRECFVLRVEGKPDAFCEFTWPELHPENNSLRSVNVLHWTPSLPGGEPPCPGDVLLAGVPLEALLRAIVTMRPRHVNVAAGEAWGNSPEAPIIKQLLHTLAEARDFKLHV